MSYDTESVQVQQQRTRRKRDATTAGDGGGGGDYDDVQLSFQYHGDGRLVHYCLGRHDVACFYAL